MRNVLKLVDENFRRLSLNEQALEKAAASYGSNLVRFTQRILLGVYPKGMRATPSNYKPILGWMHGAQMVAFYMKGYGKSLWLRHGMFRANGECGYVKKPDFLTQKGPPVKTILKVYIVGVPADSCKKKTKIFKVDWAPVWDEEFQFNLKVTELALLRIEVREYDRSKKDDFGGQTCLPVSELKYGFKAVPLYNKKEDKFKFVKFFMRFQFL